MRLTLFLCLLAATATDAQQIGGIDRDLAYVRPVQFCVNLNPRQIKDDFAIWTYPGGQIAPVDIRNDMVPAIPGQAFGFELQAASPDLVDGVTITVDHPPQPDTGQTRHEWAGSIPMNGRAVSFYGFGDPAEVVPGRWEFTYSYEDRVIYRHAFTLVAMDPQPESCAALAALTGG